MAELEANKKRLQELRESALAEAKTHNFEDMTHEQKEKLPCFNVLAMRTKHSTVVYSNGILIVIPTMQW